jgi:hypothetical protein
VNGDPAASTGLQLDVPCDTSASCDQVVTLEVHERPVDFDRRKSGQPTTLQQLGAKDLFE